MSDELKARIAELEAQAPSALKEKRRSAESRIAELERLHSLVKALNHTAQYIAWREFGECRGFYAAIATPVQVIEIARAALAAVKPATMPNGLTEAETTASDGRAGLMGGE